MSLLSSTASRAAGPSTFGRVAQLQKTVLSKTLPAEVASFQQSRNKGTVPSQAGYLVKRKQQSERKVKRTKVAMYRPLPPAQKTHPLLKAEVQNPVQLPKLEQDSLTSSEIVGQAAAFDLPTNDPLRVFGLPKNPLLEFRLLHKPFSVVRQVTKDTVELLEKAKDLPSSQTRLVMTGKAGTGKSYLLFQAIEHCAKNEWLVVYIPRAINLVNNTSPYTYDIRTQTYLQPAYSFQTLQRMLTANAELLSKIPLVEDIVLDADGSKRAAEGNRVIKKGTPLSQVIEVIIKEREKSRNVAAAPIFLEAVMKTLERQKQYPVLLAVDDIQALYIRKSAYKDPHFQAIKPYHLSLPRLLLEYASGIRSFQRGAFLSAVSTSAVQYPMPVELVDAIRTSLPAESPDVVRQKTIAEVTAAYAPRDKALVRYAEGLKALSMPEKFTLEEAASAYEVWKGQGTVRGNHYDEVFLAKYTESAGNPKDFIWKGLLASTDVA
ncbi:hypothetical protein CVT24_011828 [Panaeolus cyanescens]|uniref:Small ribosomal subunit protein mS29 n=1 Tax=Panaeolus cyanescens TaxID=181874 RepID=A0A409YP02_9AGAR|nr:hypothetical protein CVT24_011828 [Panaeolus cyanescens]